MIPDFPELKKKYHQLMMMALKEKIDENSPMVSNASKKIFFEGNKMGILRENGVYEENEMRQMSVELNFSKEEIAGLTNEQIHEKLNEAAMSMALQMGKAVLETVDKAIKETGNEIPSPDGLTQKWIHEALRKIPVSFEDDDPAKPIMMTIFVGPEVFNKFNVYYQNLSELEKEEYDKEYLEIMKVKYQEHIDDLNQRILIID